MFWGAPCWSTHGWPSWERSSLSIRRLEEGKGRAHSEWTASGRNGNTRIPNSSPGRTMPASLIYLVVFSMVANNNLVLKIRLKKGTEDFPNACPEQAQSPEERV